MGTLSITRVAQNKTTIASGDVNTPFTEIEASVNDITNAQINSAAAIAFSKLAADAWTDWTSVLTGWSGTPTQTVKYVKLGRIVIMYIAITGTSNSTGLTFTIPYAPTNNPYFMAARATDNGALNSATSLSFSSGSTTVTGKLNDSATGFTASGTKYFEVTIIYQSTS